MIWMHGKDAGRENGSCNGVEPGDWARDCAAIRPRRAQVVIHGTDAQRSRNVVEEIEAAGGKAAACLGDVAADGFGEQLAEFAVDRFGALDIFVANAGMAGFAPFLEMSPEVFRSFMDVHVTGSFTTSQAAARRMVAAGRGGRILYMSSISAMNAMYGYAGYCSAKSGVMGLMRVAALELAARDYGECAGAGASSERNDGRALGSGASEGTQPGDPHRADCPHGRCGGDGLVSGVTGRCLHYRTGFLCGWRRFGGGALHA